MTADDIGLLQPARQRVDISAAWACGKIFEKCNSVDNDSAPMLRPRQASIDPRCPGRSVISCSTAWLMVCSYAVHSFSSLDPAAVMTAVARAYSDRCAAL